MGMPAKAVSPFVPCPPAETHPYIGVAPLRPGAPSHFVALNPNVKGFLCHWTGKQTEACTLHMGSCAYCESGRRAEWHGYTGVAVLPFWRIALLHFPRGCYRASRSILAAEGNLRGLKLSLYRRGDHARSSLVAWCEETKWDRPVPPALDLPRCLARLLEVAPAVFGVEVQP